MNITFATKSLQKLCNSQKKLRGEYGSQMAEKIQARLMDLLSVEHLGIMKVTAGRCHALHADRAGQFAVDLSHPKRLVFRPTNDPLPEKDGTLIWELVTDIEIVEITDYHN